MDWRRAARGAIGALGLAGLLALGGARYPAVTPAYADPSVVNAKLARIETYLRHSPHVGQLRTCLASGAEMGIVHIRQIHNLIGNYGIVREIRERGTEADGLHAILLLDEFGLVVNMVQEDIYGILKGMMDDLGLRSVRVEGYLEPESRDETRLRYVSTIISGLEAGSPRRTRRAGMRSYRKRCGRRLAVPLWSNPTLALRSSVTFRVGRRRSRSSAT